MKQYINKSRVVAEIEKMLQDLVVCKEHTSFVEQRVVLWAKIDMCKEILSFIDTLEEKEVDFKERFTWKPSKEQIIALRWVLNNIPYNKHKEEISGLLDQIKDL